MTVLFLNFGLERVMVVREAIMYWYSFISLGNPLSKRFLVENDSFRVRSLVFEDNFITIQPNTPKDTDKQVIKPQGLLPVKLRLSHPVLNPFLKRGDLKTINLKS